MNRHKVKDRGIGVGSSLLHTLPGALLITIEIYDIVND